MSLRMLIKISITDDQSKEREKFKNKQQIYSGKV